MIDSSFITFVALVLSVMVGSVVLARRGKTMSWLERIGLVGLVVYFPFVLGLTLGGIPIGEGAWTRRSGEDGPTWFRLGRSAHRWRLGWRVVSVNWSATCSFSFPSG